VTEYGGARAESEESEVYRNVSGLFLSLTLRSHAVLGSMSVTRLLADANQHH